MKSKVDWDAWGSRDPLFGVDGRAGKEKTGPHPWTDEQFFAVGAAHWANHLRQWQQYGMNPGVCVEIGCGAGRMTRHLTECFAKVYAIDISISMIAYAARHVDRNRVVFCVTNGKDLPIADQSATAVFSTYVFQHFEGVSEAADYFREIYRVLSGGCSMMILLPVFTWPGTGVRTLLSRLYRLRQQLTKVQNAYKRFRLARSQGAPFCPSIQYEIDWLHETLSEIGFQDVEIRIVPVKVHEGWESFVLARKPPAALDVGAPGRRP
ncbi:MAG: class I SAM-dependent methyltransferase [Acidobacteria bacterium]|nr:class I SAM-dependent methyltransferase [Acidobacteriota bacterium]